MSYEVSRYGGGGLARMNRAELARIERATEIVVHKVRAMAYVGEVAVNRAVILQLTQTAAEQIAPNGSEMYAAIVQTTTTQIIGVLAELGYALR